MNIRWRLSVVAIQLLILTVATYIATGEFYTAATWFSAGLFSVIISSQILEPFYSSPADVIGNVVISLLLYLTTPKLIAKPAWIFFLITLISILIFALIALIFGAGKYQGRFLPLAKFSKMIAGKATALYIYSVIFWLALIEAYPKYDDSFWALGISWAIIIFIGSINWQKTFQILLGTKQECVIEEMISPSRISISTPKLPLPGNSVILKTKSSEVRGTVISRIQRQNDVWGQIYIENREDSENLLKAHHTLIEIQEDSPKDVVGIADIGSTQAELVFYPNRPLEIGTVVSVQHEEQAILYQIHSAKIEKLDIKGGSQLQVQAKANQIGFFDESTLRLHQHRWVPTPGSSVTIGNSDVNIDEGKEHSSAMLIGHILGTKIPIYLDIKLMTEGHFAIFGMTKMGKTSFAIQLINKLAHKQAVTVLDQTGEYKSKRNFPSYDENHDRAFSGVVVHEPLSNQPPATMALSYLNKLMGIARTEYEHDTSNSRAILIEEAHQFIPEPAGVSYGDERTSAVKLGSLMMQIRKYRICIILITQRTAVVAKSALSQCENIIAFKSGDRTGLNYFDTISGQDISNILPTLKQGEAIVFGPAFSCDTPVAIKIPEVIKETNMGIFKNKIESNGVSAEVQGFDVPEPPPNFPEFESYPEPPDDFDDIPF